MSFSRRLTLAAAGAVAAAILLMSGIVYLVVREQLRGEVDDALQEAAGRVDKVRVTGPGPGPQGPGAPGPSGMGGGGPPPRGPIPFPIPLERGEQLGGARAFVQVIGLNGEILRPRGAADVALPVTPQALAIAGGKDGRSFHDATVAGVHVRILTVRSPVDGFALQIARPLNEVDSVLGRLRWILLFVSLAGVALAAAAGLLVARSALAPVRRLTGAAEHVAETQDLSQRMEPGGSERDELGRLGTAFNRMLDALRRSRSAQQQLVADASHELRTPLTSMRANLELLQAGDRLPAHEREAVMRDLVSQTDELTGLVGDLVDLARDGEAPLERDIVRLDEVVRTALARARPRAPWMPFLDTDVEPTEVFGDRAALERAVINLLDNAIKFSPPDASTEVTVRGGRIAVRDHGPGIPDDELPLVFDRFYRSAEARARPGSGLGLAIVRQVAEAHGGTAYAENAAGGGTRLVIDIPVLAPPEG